MEASNKKRSCVKCPKGPGQVSCGGCEQWFCVKHLLEHRQELSRQMDDLTHEHDQFKESLITKNNDQEHPLILRIDRWEEKSINRIKQIAEEVRHRLKKTLDESKSNIAKSLLEITVQLREQRQTDAFTENDLAKWMSQLVNLRKQVNNPSKIEIKYDEDGGTSTHLPLVQLHIFHQNRVPVHISNATNWSTHALTVIGSHGRGDTLSQLNRPYGFDFDNDGSLIIGDMNNHRLVRWKSNAVQGEIIAGGKGPGTRTDQLDVPLAVLIDRINHCLIVSEERNRRVMKWSLDQVNRTTAVTEGEVIMSNIYSLGLAMDNEGSLYVSGVEKHEVRRYGSGDVKEGVVVAGGNGQGNGLNQLHHPRQIFVDDERSVYVSDTSNHRVMKWRKNAREGIVVAGGQNEGRNLGQLSWPSGIFVDRMGTVYVADQFNHRIMCWQEGAKQGEVIIDGIVQRSPDYLFMDPATIACDDQGNLFVCDVQNHRILRFDLR